jgi:hypothetical protein
MAIGIIGYIAVTIILVFIQTIFMRLMKAQGYNQGSMDEAKQWVDAINKIQAPNWQSMPVPHGTDPEKAKFAAQIYVESFKIALEVIKEEIAMNRLTAMVDDLKKLIAEDEPRYPIA